MRIKNNKISKKTALIAVILSALLLMVLIITKNAMYLKRYNMSDPTGRINYLASLGWQVSEAQCEVMEIQLPESFGQIMQGYNQLQLESGFDLSKFAGKRCVQYTYQILNCTEDSEKMYIVLYVKGKKLIGGDVHTASLGGNMYPLTAKSTLE